MAEPPEDPNPPSDPVTANVPGPTPLTHSGTEIPPTTGGAFEAGIPLENVYASPTCPMEKMSGRSNDGSCFPPLRPLGSLHPSGRIFSEARRLTSTSSSVLSTTSEVLGKIEDVYGDWTIAWNLASKATSFLFPHRRQELDEYAEFMQGEFSARQAEAHWRVIDFDQFNRHRAAILQSDGLFSANDAKGTARRPKSNDICLRFNTDGGCPNTAASCKYRHTCRNDLSWALHHLQSLPGTHIISNLKWDPSEADVTIHVDACLEGMGFRYTDEPVGFYSPVPTTTPSNLIFYFEALCALSALIHAVSHRPRVSRIVIYSDSSNTVDIFSSFRSEPTFNHLLLAAADAIMKYHVDLRVLHIPGAENVVADAISRLHISSILDIMPDFQLSYFQPPRFPLGAMQN